MPNNPKITAALIKRLSDAWKEGAEGDSFAGQTLPQFLQKVKPSLDRRAEIESLEQQLTLARQNRNNSDDVSNEVCQAVVDGVKSHPSHGPNSALYKTMGYVPKNERKSGLVRPQHNQENQDTPSEKVA